MVRNNGNGFYFRLINEMCSRYSIVATAEEIASRFSVEVPAHFKSNFNAAPAQLLPVITSQSPQGVSTFYWGLTPSLAKNKNVTERIINIRAEQIAEKTVYRKALQSRRCIIPADGYYEWKKIGKKVTTPYRFIRKDKSLFAFAGVWEEFEDVSGTPHHTFSIFTTTGNSLVSSIHERMPVILTRDAEKLWLNHESEETALRISLKPLASDEMDVYPVTHRVNSIENNDKSLVLPAPAQDQYGNLTLFN